MNAAVPSLAGAPAPAPPLALALAPAPGPLVAHAVVVSRSLVDRLDAELLLLLLLPLPPPPLAPMAARVAKGYELEPGYGIDPPPPPPPPPPLPLPGSVALKPSRSENALLSLAVRGTGAADGLPGGGLETVLNVMASTIPAARALGSLLLSIFDLPSSSSPRLAAFPRALLDLGGTSGLGSQATPAPQTTPSRVIAAANRSAVITLMRAGAAVNAVRAASLTGWTSRDEALTWRDSAAEALSDISERISDSEGDGWRKVIDLRAAMVRDVTTRAAPLPRLYSVRPAQTISATLLAYQLDGDAASTLFARADDIVARNKIRHPAFVAGGAAIEVLK